MKHLAILLVVAGSLLAYSQTKEQPRGQIQGTVTNANGDPVTDATVYAVPQDLAFDSITPRSTTTNRNGEFDFHGGFPLGTYKLYSRKDADGYPDHSDSFYASAKEEPAKAELTEDHPSASVTVTLGERAGTVEGQVVDAATGAPVKAKLFFMDEDGNSHSVMTSGKYRALLPAGKDVSLMVMVMSADYPPQSPTAPLRLAPGQQMHMDIPVSKQ